MTKDFNPQNHDFKYMHNSSDVESPSYSGTQR